MARREAPRRIAEPVRALEGTADDARRSALHRIGLALLGAAVVGSTRSAFAATTPGLLRGPWPRLDDPARPSFDVFVALSQLVTVRRRLDRNATRAMYPLFMDEPWGAKHIAASYMGLRKALASAPRGSTAPQLIIADALGDSEKWFCTHLYTTWYLGIYYHERKTVRVLYEHALMWDAVRDVSGIPGVTRRRLGSWREPPAAR
jgi:hypothetical protein